MSKVIKIMPGFIAFLVVTVLLLHLNRGITVMPQGDPCNHFVKYSWGYKKFESKECRDGAGKRTYFYDNGEIKKVEFYQDGKLFAESVDEKQFNEKLKKAVLINAEITSIYYENPRMHAYKDKDGVMRVHPY